MSSNILEFGDASKNNKSMLFYLNEIENSVTNDVSNLKIFSNPLNELSFNIGEGLFKTKNIDLSDNLNVYGNVILESSKISTDNSNIFLPISFNNYSYKLSEELNSKIVLSRNFNKIFSNTLFIKQLEVLFFTIASYFFSF